VPDIGSLVIIGINSDIQPAFIQTEISGQKLPGVCDRLFFEVIAKGKVAQHLEKGVMPRRAPHILQIVVLAAGPHAFLGAGSPVVATVLHAQETVLKLVHAGVGEHKCGVILRNKS